MKFLKKIAIFFAVLVFATAVSVFVFLQNIKENAQLKNDSIDFAKKIKKFIYLEATNHNPEGDMFPDQIDDAVISEAKNVLN